MAKTPEGKVKDEVKKVLAEFGPDIDGFWPVPSGYGESHLDYVGCAWGVFISIETKKPKAKPTPRQLYRIQCVVKAGGIALTMDGTEETTTYAQLRELLMRIRDNRK